MNRFVRVRPVFLVVPVVLLFFFLALDSLVGDSPTMDEQNHLARGLAFLRTGDPRLSLEHPPLVNTLSALPLLTLPEIRLPTDHPSWEQPQGWYAFAEQLLWVYNDDVDRMIFLARLPIVYLALALALVGFRFARTLWGRLAALFAFVFLLFDPNIMAHGRYTTTDLGGATFLLLAAFLLWRLWAAPDWSWWRVAAAGLGLGLALGSKLSNLFFVPVFAFLALLPLYGTAWHWRGALRRLAAYVLAGLLSLFVLWLIYGLEWGRLPAVPEPAKLFQGITMPMPTFWAGIRQILELSAGGRPVFLLGQFSTEGWWYYFPVAFGVKTPLPILGLFLLAGILLVRKARSRGPAIYLLLPAVLYFLASMSSALNIGYRHLLPMLPLLYVMASGLAAPMAERRPDPSARRTVVPLFLYGSLAAVLLIDLFIHPHYLSYFNLLAGGPANGHRVLIDSNIDWGQDLLRLKGWMRENEVEQLKLAWFGTADPAYYDLNYEPLPGLTHHFDLWWAVPFDSARPEPGTYAISVSNLWELPLAEKHVFPWFRSRQPDDRIGYSINIYVVEETG